MVGLWIIQFPQSIQSEPGSGIPVRPYGGSLKNLAECTIQTWTNHFIAGLFITDPKLMMHLFCCLLQQCTLTLNFLSQYWRNPWILTYTALESTFDFNKTPPAPPGWTFSIHKKPDERRAWSPHGADKWHIGPDIEPCMLDILITIPHISMQ